jgi:hypothetical protein
MQRVNWERGMKRVCWVLTAPGAVVAVIGIVGSLYVAGDRLLFIQRVQRDPRFDKLTVELQEEYRQRWWTETEKRLQNWYPSAIGGALWFALPWTLYFLIRWIATGFREPSEGPPSDR